MLQTELEQEIVTPERRLAIQQAAQAMADTILSDMSGQHIFVRRTTVQGSGYALPQPAIGSTTSSEPEEQENLPSGSIIDKAKNLLWGQPKQQPPTQSNQPIQPTQQPSSHTEQLEQLYNTDPQAFAEMVNAIRQKSQQPQSPLQQPPLNTSASQQGMTNGQNGHAKQ
jgi:hypothetical protein